MCAYGYVQLCCTYWRREKRNIEQKMHRLILRTSSARATTASLLFDGGPPPDTDWIAMLRLHSGAMSNHSGSRIPSKQSFATGYMAPLPSRSISGAVCYKYNTITVVFIHHIIQQCWQATLPKFWLTVIPALATDSYQKSLSETRLNL